MFFSNFLQRNYIYISLLHMIFLDSSITYESSFLILLVNFSLLHINILVFLLHMNLLVFSIYSWNNIFFSVTYKSSFSSIYIIYRFLLLTNHLVFSVTLDSSCIFLLHMNYLVFLLHMNLLVFFCYSIILICFFLLHMNLLVFLLHMNLLFLLYT